MELSNRVELESKLAAKLSRLYGTHRRRIMAALKATGEPVDASKIPASLWQQIEDETQQQLAEEILLIYLLVIAASNTDLSLGITDGTMRKLGSAYSAVRSRDIAKKMTDNSRQRVEAGSDPLEVFSPERAGRVAQTEVSVAQSEASIDSVKSPEAKQDQKAAADKEDASDDEGSDKGESGDKGKGGKKKERLTLVAYWRHSRVRPPGHAGASKRPCAICTPRLDKPESQWGGLVPGQAHPNCVLPGTMVSARGVLAAFSGFYNGPAIKLTVGGRNFSVTEQHKFLGPLGFVGAASINKGDYLVNCGFAKGGSLGHPHNNYGPSLIEDVVCSFSKSFGVLSPKVPVSSEYFNGDAAFLKSNIDIVFSHRLLSHAPVPSGVKPKSNLPLCYGWEPSFFDTLSPLDLCLTSYSLAAHGVMGSSGLAKLFFGSHFASSNQSSLGLASGNESECNHFSSENGSTDAQSFGRLQERFAGLVAFDQVENVERFDFCGHVYDLQTESGLYDICGVTSSNCDCFVEFVAVNNQTPQPSAN